MVHVAEYSRVAQSDLETGDRVHTPTMVTLPARLKVSPVRVVALLSVVAILWILLNSGSPPPELQQQQSGQETSAAVSSTTEAEDPLLRVDVYYEVLCPDSRFFVLQHLLPTHEKVGSLLDIHLWPYGKATTKAVDDDYVFDCQHGPTECEGNQYHACVEHLVQDSDTRLQLVKCMINDNNFPERVARECAAGAGVGFDQIQECAAGREGRRLHAEAGRRTGQLSPPVSFIPTVELGGSQHSQPAILKNLLKEVCRVYSSLYLRPGEKIASCPAL